jgi:ParB family transcriptional regulator, chromosome partitioning protein
MIIHISSKNLTISKMNVRSQDDDEAALKQLAASIASVGLIHPLSVQQGPKKNGYAIIAGGRRFRALQLLQQEGKIADDYPIACIEHAADGLARERSLAENITRQAMHPMDECAAFLALGTTEKLTIEEIAAKFGITARHVKQRLQLASLHPKIAAAYRKYEITLDIAQAFAETDNQELQLQIFKSGHFSRYYILDKLRAMGVDQNDIRVKIVGKKAYLAAGGSITEGLFDDDVRYNDIDILDTIMAEKTSSALAKLRKSQRVEEVRLAERSWLSATDTKGLIKLVPTPRARSADEEQELIDTAKRYDELLAKEEDECLTADETLEADSLYDRIETLEKPTSPIDPAELQSAIIFATWDQNGKLEPLDGHFKVASTLPKQSADNGSADDTQSNKQNSTAASESQALARTLADARTQILKARMAADGEIALDVLLFQTVASSFQAYFATETELNIRVDGGHQQDGQKEPTDSKAAEELAALHAALPLSWLHEDSIKTAFNAFRQLDMKDKLALNAFATADSLHSCLHQGSDRSSVFHDILGVMLGINLTDYWTPTAANYWQRVSKSTMLEALETWGGPALRSRHDGLKKPDLAAVCERYAAGTVIEEASIKQAAMSHVVPSMRFCIEDGDANDHLTDTSSDDGVDNSTTGQNSIAA